MEGRHFKGHQSLGGVRICHKLGCSSLPSLTKAIASAKHSGVWLFLGAHIIDRSLRSTMQEFNEENEMRKIPLFGGLRHQRLFKHTSWFEQVYLLFVLDHGQRNVSGAAKEIKVLTNLYL
jgi:hypothetical protein